MNWSNQYWETLRGSPAFRRFWLGVTVSRTGDTMTVVALSWLVVNEAGAAELGLALMFFGLPRVLSGPLNGMLMDRYSRRLVIAVDNAGRAIAIGVLALFQWSGDLQMWHVYGAALACALLSPASDIGERTLTPHLVPDSRLDSANGLLSISWELSTIAGPALAGGLIHALGVAPTLIVDAGSFLVMALVALRLPRESDLTKDSSSPAPAFGGFRLLVTNRAILLLTVAAFGVLVTGGTMEVLLPVYSTQVLHAGVVQYSALLTVCGAGALLGLLVYAPRLRDRPPHRALAFVLLATGVSQGLLVLADTVLAAAVILFVASVVGAPFYAMERTLIQRTVPDHLLGRVAGAQSAFRTLGFPLGAASGGAALGLVPVAAVLITVSAILVALSLMLAGARSLHGAVATSSAR
ncbi:MFS transporter [Nonomuraea mesophila]|uniref:MFS transporter n=1 Tax=Nonomuraea mesophila TaxID=2530382 RepID=UPI00140ACF49|nr:MFS transporter [Nonomuraea mesophila]